jgi:hypothetical protein
MERPDRSDYLVSAPGLTGRPALWVGVMGLVLEAPLPMYGHSNRPSMGRASQQLQQATHLMLCPKHVCADLGGHAATTLFWMRAACTGLGDTERRQVPQSFHHR